MKVAFDLDGTLDKPALRNLALSLLSAGHEVHIVSGCFLEAGDWQDETAKLDKLVRLGLAQAGDGPGKYKLPEGLRISILEAVSHERFDRDYRLADLGLRKGAYIEKNGIEIMFDDSELYCKLMPAYCGAVIAQVR
jgi:hypothetical protein